MSSSSPSPPHTAAAPLIDASNSSSWDSLRGALALELAGACALEESLPAAAALVRAALQAGNVVIEALATGQRWEARAAAPAIPAAAAVELRVELHSGARRLGTVTVGFPRQAPPRAELEQVIELLAPLVLLEESRRAAREARAASSDQLAQQERFISMVVDSLPLGLYVVDRDYQIRLWSRGREKGLQGVAREDALGRSIFEVLHRLPAERLRTELDRVMESGEIVRFEAESTAFGDRRSYRLSRIPMRFDGGDVTHVIAIGEDITDWKQAQLRTSRAEKLAAVGQLAAGVMHEVNNPLATIGACAETLALETVDGVAPDPAMVRELVGIIEHEVHRCRRLVDDLLGFSRQSPGERALLDVEQVLDETFALLAHHSRFRKARVRRERSRSPLPPVTGSREQLMQVFMALLLNAVDATAGGGEIVTTTSAAGDGVTVSVHDEGAGIPAAELPRIFEPFFTTKPPGQGTGLGLAISYGIVTDHGGRIDVESTPGQGSTFRVVLPAAEAA